MMKPGAMFGFAFLVALAAPAAAQEPSHAGGSDGEGASGEHELGNVIRDFARIPTGDPIETAERGLRVVRRHAGGGLHRDQILRAIGNPETVTVPVTEELRRHARRVARLRRIRSLADEAGRGDLVARARRLLRLELARHQTRLGTLMGRDGPLDLSPLAPRERGGHAHEGEAGR